MLVAHLFLVVCISIATADVITDLEPLQAVDCGGKVCKNGATCKSGNTCVCPEGTKGDECEEVIGCAKLKESCTTLGTECIYNNYTLSATCNCKDEKKRFDGRSCADCNCGEFVQSCEFTDGGKYCFCKKGYSDKNGMCSPCSCGEFEERCDFYKDEKSCMCKDGYRELNGICTRCTCGARTKSCGFINGEIFCNCEEGYQFRNGTCAECDCGTNSTSCIFDEKTAAKLCLCKDRNKVRFGTCTPCYCGPDELCSFTSTGKQQCDCIGESCREPGKPWYKNPVVVVCIVVLVGIVVSIPAFVAYRKLRRNR